jgi:hypothetical protein
MLDSTQQQGHVHVATSVAVAMDIICCFGFICPSSGVSHSTQAVVGWGGGGIGAPPAAQMERIIVYIHVYVYVYMCG